MTYTEDQPVEIYVCKCADKIFHADNCRFKLSPPSTNEIAIGGAYTKLLAAVEKLINSKGKHYYTEQSFKELEETYQAIRNREVE